jgi:hypothetical protein
MSITEKISRKFNSSFFSLGSILGGDKKHVRGPIKAMVTMNSMKIVDETRKGESLPEFIQVCTPDEKFKIRLPSHLFK